MAAGRGAERRAWGHRGGRGWGELRECVGRKTRPKRKLKFKFKLKIPFLPYFTPILFSLFALPFYLLAYLR
jgi:hypothetical protein